MNYHLDKPVKFLPGPPTVADRGWIRPPDTGLMDLKPFQDSDFAHPKEQDVAFRPEATNTLAGIPQQQLERTVFIYSPAKTNMQSGVEKTHQWLLEFENPERWRNPLMGWSSTADPMSNMKLYFSSQENAIGYAERQGFSYALNKNVTPTEGSNDRGIVKSYADVFKYKGTRRRPRKFSV